MSLSTLTSSSSCFPLWITFLLLSNEYHTHSGLKQHPLMISLFCKLQAQVGSLFRVSQGQNQDVGQAGSYLEALGRICFLAHSGYWQVLVSLLAVTWVCGGETLSSLNLPIFILIWLLHLQKNNGKGALLSDLIFCHQLDTSLWLSRAHVSRLGPRGPCPFLPRSHRSYTAGVRVVKGTAPLS